MIICSHGRGRKRIDALEGAYTELMNLMECVESKEDALIQIVRKHQHHTYLILLHLTILRNIFKVKQMK
jgi:hypothetical protein